MTSALILYSNPRSRGQVARWMLEETGQAYSTVMMEFGKAMHAPEYLALNPMGKVPTLRHGSRVITETAAICAYLADAFPEAGLAPALDKRADYYRWLFFAAGPVEQAVTHHYLRFDPEGDQRSMVGYGHYELAIDTLEYAVSQNQYLAEDTFSAADVYVGSMLDWGMMFGTIKSRPAFEHYVARLRKRPAYKMAKEKDMALLSAR